MTNHRNKLPLVSQLCSFVLAMAVIAGSAQAQAPNRAGARGQQSGVGSRPAFSWPVAPGISSLMPAGGPSLQVIGGGTLGRLTKWTGFTSSNSVIGDTSIFEDKLGNVGIGTDAPMSRLTVQGMIQTTLGGLKFPDGTIQTTSASGALFTVAHDQTLTGDGTASSLLGVAVPLSLSGRVPFSLGDDAVVRATNMAGGTAVSAISEQGFGLKAVGAEAVRAVGLGSDGIGLRALGAGNLDAPGGGAMVAEGGFGGSGNGGDGLRAFGGDGGGAGHHGGAGIFAAGGGGGFSGASSGPAGHFEGDVEVTGNLSKGGGSFKIDHPLDPENKYLYHSFVESPDMMNIYNGNVMTDASGDAVVTLPDWFEALNRDFRYQLTVIGTFAQAIVAEKVNGNHFKIKTNAQNVEVSWQVTGIRQDAYANKHRIPVEETKPEVERGSYLHPDVFDQPDERNVEWARRPELMRRIMQMREKAVQPMQ